MKIGGALLIVLLGSSLLGCSNPAKPEDREALVGLWIPDDGSRHTIEFMDTGAFEFVYDPGPIKTTLLVKWSMETKGKVDIRQHDGSHYKTCKYAIDAGKLTIDDGGGAGCIRSATTADCLHADDVYKEPLNRLLTAWARAVEPIRLATLLGPLLPWLETSVPVNSHFPDRSILSACHRPTPRGSGAMSVMMRT
jgi:hypothetical protein